MTIAEHHLKSSNQAIELRVFTLNIWGIPKISKDRQERVKAIAHHLASVHEPYHYVFLQEVWSKEDFTLIASKVSKILPFSHYFFSGVNGSGICVLSCTPIQEVHFHKFSLNGYPHKIFHGDWFGGKGVGLCKTSYKGIPILLGITHLHAEYNEQHDQYLHHRVVQAYEISQVLRFAQLGTHVSIFSGDLNCQMSDVPYRLLTYNTGYTDSYVDCPIKPADGVGATNETPCNSYTTAESLRLNPNGKRIDFIFHWSSREYQVKTLVQDQPLPTRVIGTEFSYSDHEAVRSIISIVPNQDIEALNDTTLSSNNNPESICFNRTDSLLDASAVCTQGLRTVEKCQKMHAAIGTISSILLVILLGLSYSAVPGTARLALNLLTILTSVGMAYALSMAIVFCAMEHNAMLTAKQGLEKLLEEVRENNSRYFEAQKKAAAPKQ